MFSPYESCSPDQANTLTITKTDPLQELKGGVFYFYTLEEGNPAAGQIAVTPDAVSSGWTIVGQPNKKVSRWRAGGRASGGL